MQDGNIGRLYKVAKDVYSLIWDKDDSIHSGYGANQGFVVLQSSVLIFDTGFSTFHAKSLDSAIRQVTDKKARFIVNSHDHSDHVFGNSYFSKKYSRNGLDIISNGICARRLRKLGLQRLRDYKKSDKSLLSLLSSVEIVPPNITYQDNLSLNIEGTEFVLIHPESGAHTLGDTIAAIPKKGVIFFGDVLCNSFFPNLEDANLEGWIDFLDNIDYKTYTKFVPGHGKVCGKEQVFAFSNYLRVVQKRLLSTDPKTDRQKLRSCFEIDGTESWKFRRAVELNIDALFGNSVISAVKNLK